MAKRKILVERKTKGGDWEVSTAVMSDTEIARKNDSLGWIKYRRLVVES